MRGAVQPPWLTWGATALPRPVRIRLAGGTAEGEVTHINKSGKLEVHMDTTAWTVLSLANVELIQDGRTGLFEYEVHETDRGVGLICQRKNCGGKFIVNLEMLREMKEASNIKGVACPYCSRVSLVP